MANNTFGLRKFNETIQNDKVHAYLNNVLSTKKDQFVTSLVSLVGNSPLLQDCEPMSVLYAAVKATALNLPFDPNIGTTYCVPYYNSKTRQKEAQFQLGARGLAQLAIRSGQFQKIYTTPIYEGEFGGVKRKTGEVTIIDGVDITDKPVVGYYGYFRLNNGYEYEIYKSKAEIQAHAKRFSKTVDNGPWKTDFDAMALKTVLKMLLKQGNAPMSVDMAEAEKADQSVIRVKDGVETLDYVDNPTNVRDNANANTEVIDVSNAEVVDNGVELPVGFEELD